MVQVDVHNCGKVIGKMQLIFYTAIIKQVHTSPEPYPLSDIGFLSKHNTNLIMRTPSQVPVWYPRHDSFQWHLIHTSHESAHGFVSPWVHLCSRVCVEEEQANLKWGHRPGTWRKEVRDFDPINQMSYEVLSWQWNWPWAFGRMTCEKDCQHVSVLSVSIFIPGQARK